MSDNSSIEWTDATWGPTTGCDRVSEGCDHCYALTLAKRLKAMGSPKYQTDGDPRTSGPGFGLAMHPDSLDAPLHWRKPRKVFVNSMSDLFHAKVSDEFIGSVWNTMALTPQHTYQILTKRPGRMRSLLKRWEADGWHWRDHHMRWCGPIAGPLPNVWLGCSVETQHWADIRIPALLETPAAVRFLSCEPLLGPVNLSRWLDTPLTCGCGAGQAGAPDAIGCCAGCMTPEPSGIDWVIAGGESGHGARPMHPDWARLLRDQCVAARVPFHFKQWGEWGPAPWSVRVCDPAVGWQGTREELVQAKARAEAEGATHHIQPSGHLYEPEHKTWSLERDPDGDYPGAVRRWGKKAAGRDLDGRTWDEFPAVAS